MGSRAVVVICRSAEAASARFGITDGSSGLVYTRTGRPFFNDPLLHTAFLERLRTAMTRADFWNEFATEWFVFDCELMPWSAKAMQLIRQQYAGTGIAARTMLAEANKLLGKGRKNGLDVTDLQDYCDKDYQWHMETLHRLCEADPEWLLATPFRVVDVNDEQDVTRACEWWETLTTKGGEGMVVKPFDFVARGGHGLVEPAIKCRGREYLRIIYGPEYTLPQHLEALRRRGLGAKRSLRHAGVCPGYLRAGTFCGPATLTSGSRMCFRSTGPGV